MIRIIQCSKCEKKLAEVKVHENIQDDHWSGIHDAHACSDCIEKEAKESTEKETTAIAVMEPQKLMFIIRMFQWFMSFFRPKPQS